MQAHKRRHPIPGKDDRHDRAAGRRPKPEQKLEQKQNGAGPLAVAALFLGCVAVFVMAGRLPAMILGLYLGASVVAVLVYALDKSAARNGRWRTSERTLLMVGLAGGWPGAVLAQQFLRHKSRKQAFQQMFWITVVLNCCALAWLLSPSGVDVLRFFSAPDFFNSTFP